MFPLFDSTPRKSFPYINYLLIFANVLVFIMEITSPYPDTFILDTSFISANFHFLDPFAYIPLFFSLFVHGSILHLLANMWFLHIFGDNVEDRLGHFNYLLFYLIGGVIADLSQYLLDPHSTIPMVGASGAISAVAGAYFVFFRHSKVKSIIPIFFIFPIIDIPAWLFLGFWFFIQLFFGLGSLTTMAQGGVAWFAHVGGFMFGFFAATFIRNSTPEVEAGQIIS